MEAVKSPRLLGGRYRLVERLGGAGMSVVWRAYDEVLGRQVAVKMVAAEHVKDAASREWIRMEAQAAARLSHPHITSVYDYGESRDKRGQPIPYVVMELVHGPTLANRMGDGPLPLRTALLICAQVAAGLAAAHARGLVHRDIKPGNVVLSPTGAKVVDFGIAAVAGQPGTAGGLTWGTPAYLAPERLTEGEVLPASDVYALGLLLYRMLANTLPWRAKTIDEMLDAHRYAEPAPLPDLPGLPDEVAELCRRCLAKQPEERPTAAEAARVLAASSGWHATADETSGDIVVGAGGALPGVALSGVAFAGDESQTRLVPLVAKDESAGGRAAVVETTDRRRRAVAALTAAGVLLAVALLAGFCVPNRHGGTVPGGRGPGASAQPGATSTGPTGTPSAQPGAGTGAAASPGAVAAGGSPGAKTGGGGPGPRPAPPPPKPGPTPVDRTVTTPGGSATCRCTGPTATLIAFDPLPGFTPTDVNRGPAPVVGLVFDGMVTDVRVSFRCNNGVPQATVS